jgi:hypothetical protein
MRTQVLIPLPGAQFLSDTGTNQLVNITLTGVPNPQGAGETLPFEINYVDLDTLNMRTTTRGVRNIPNTLSFVNAPYSFSLSRTQIEVTKGTYSEPITLTQGIAAYDPMKVTLFSDNTELKFDPEELIYRFDWGQQNTFRIGVSNSSLSGTFVVGFAKSEDTNYERFQPIGSVTVLVTEPKGLHTLLIDPIPELEYYATSLPIAVSLGSPTLYPVTVQLSTTGPSQDDSVIFEPQVLAFNPGDKVKTFTITTTTKSQSGTITATMSGYGQGPYQTSAQTALSVLSYGVRLPSLMYAGFTQIGRVAAEVEVFLTRMGTVYYACLWAGSQAPAVRTLIDQQEVLNNAAPQVIGLAYTSTMPESSSSLYPNAYRAVLHITGLQEDTSYTLYVTKMGLYEQPDEQELHIRPFRTSPAYPPAQVTIRTSAPRNPAIVRTALAQVMGIPKPMIEYLGEDYNTTESGQVNGNRRLQGTYPYKFAVVMNREIEIGSPFDLVRRLDTRRDILYAYLPEFWASDNLTSTITTYPESPEFIYSPRISETTRTSLSIEAIQTTSGRIYGVALDLRAPRPSVQQILRGLDAYNVQVPAGRFQSARCNAQRATTLKFTELEYFTRYRIWLVGVNNFGAFPTLMSEKHVRAVYATVGKKGSEISQPSMLLKLDEGAEWLGACLLLSLVIS